MTSEDQVVLDPFLGSGTTLLAARACGKRGVGLEIYQKYLRLASSRLSQGQLPLDGTPPPSQEIHEVSAARLKDVVAAESVDLCVTSPPYWDILTQRRTADNKAIRNYGHNEEDLGTIGSYDGFLKSLGDVFEQVLVALRPGKYCCVVVMDLRKKGQFFPFHSDVAQELLTRGFVFDDLIIWNRAGEYNNLRPLGYPAVFRINKVHEFILVFRKP
jgi:DNA modification methylase